MDGQGEETRLTPFFVRFCKFASLTREWVDELSIAIAFMIAMIINLSTFAEFLRRWK